MNLYFLSTTLELFNNSILKIEGDEITTIEEYYSVYCDLEYKIDSRLDDKFLP